MTNVSMIIPFTTAKQGYLETLSSYDEATLSRLVKIAEFIVYPDDEQLIRVTMEQMVDRAHELADIHFPEWTDRSKTDFGEFLVELMALFSEKDFFYANAFHNEGFLQKAKMYSGIYLHAKRLSYTPVTITSAKGWVSCIFEAGSSCQYYPGDLKFLINDIQYVNCEQFVVPETATTYSCNVRIAEGTYDSFQTRFNGRSVRIQSENVDIESVEQNVDGEKWSRVESFANSANDDKHFLVLPQENGSAEVTYGKNDFGMLPVYDSVIDTKFRTCSGASGNQENDNSAVTVSENNGTRPITSATWVGDIYGGVDAENIERIRLNVPHSFRTLSRIINTDDCERMLSMRSDIYQAKATIWGTVMTFYVIPSSGTPADAAFLAELQEEYENYNMDGTTIASAETDYVDVDSISLTVYALRGYDETDMRNKILDIVENWTNPLTKAEYGKGFVFSDVTQEIIRSIPGTRNVTDWAITGDGTIDADGMAITSIQITNKVNRANISLTFSY